MEALGSVSGTWSEGAGGEQVALMAKLHLWGNKHWPVSELPGCREPEDPPRGWAPVYADSTGTSPTEQEINWKSRITIKPRSRKCGGGHD